MILRMALVGVFACGAAWATEHAPRTAEQPAQQKEGVIDPQADAQLRRMSDFLAGMKSLRVDATTIDERITKDGQKIQELKESKVAVKRPNGLMISRQGPRGSVLFRYDGKQFSILLPEKNEYGMASAPKDLDAAIDAARDRLHIDAPGGDLLVTDPYRDLTDGVLEARYVGREPVGNVMAHHLAFVKKDVDFQIWIQDGDQPVPLRYVITTKDLPGRPQFTLELRNWEPNASIAADTFAFMPPQGAKRIELAPQKKMER